MYRVLRLSYSQPCMKREIAWYMKTCLTGRMVKEKHHRPHGKLQPLGVPMWKWEHFTIDFITSQPNKAKGFDVIWDNFDRLTKSAHFLEIQESSLPRSWPMFMCAKSLPTMGCQFLSSLTMMYGLLLGYGKTFMMIWVRDYISSPLVTLKLMGRVSGPFCYLRMC